MHKNIYCSNCGRVGHVYKKCNDPITSIGIIAFKLENNVENNVENDLNYYSRVKMINIIKDKKINIVTNSNIKFLLVRRKHTLGFIEFIRGRYLLKHNNTIKILFQQMTQEEIYKISINSFDKLWHNIWVTNYKNYKNEFEITKRKYLKLRNREKYNLSYFCRNIKPKWDNAEWGFPKGRRNIKEDPKSCAVREFIEETNYTKKDFKILKQIKPISELFHGTNGIQYKHVYFISKIMTDNIPVINTNNKNQYSEIGDIGWFTYEEASQLIRSYQQERLFILNKLYCHILKKYYLT